MVGHRGWARPAGPGQKGGGRMQDRRDLAFAGGGGLDRGQALRGDAAAQALIDAANNAGGEDNITAVLAQIKGTGQE